MNIIIIPPAQQWWMIFTTTLLSLFVLTVSSSSSSSSSSSFHNSNNNYNVYQYDRTSSHFTPDGRLMQVEYACSAADHSSPLIVFQYNTNTEKEQDDDQLLILLTLKRSSATTTTTTTSSSGNSPNTGNSSNSSSSSQFLQQRLVLLPDNHCMIVLSGILADCTFLLHKLQEDDLHHRRLFGSGGAGAHVLTPQKIASCLSLACQKHAIGGGIRPFGSTFYIAAASHCPTTTTTTTPTCPPLSSSSSSSFPPFQLYRTDPSGAVQSLPIGAAAGDASFSPTGMVCPPPPLILGGAYVEGTDRLRRRLISEWSRLPQETVSAMLISVTRILLQEQQNKALATASTSTSTLSTTDDAAAIQPPPPPSSLEVAVISVKHGTYKLSETQIKHLLQKACSTIESKR